MAKTKFNKDRYKMTNDYYNLKLDAVNSLAEALNEDPYKKTEHTTLNKGQDPYKIDKLSKVPTWIKAFFVKFWFGGLICYLIMWGLGIYVTGYFDMFLLLGLVTGVATDLFVNTAFLYFESDKLEYHKYMMLPISCKKVWTLLINIPYGMLEVFCIYGIYVFINSYISNGSLGVEPILYGTLYLIVDMALISIKNLIIKIISKNRKASN